MQKVNIKGQSVQKIQNKQTDEQTDRGMEAIALPDLLVHFTAGGLMVASLPLATLSSIISIPCMAGEKRQVWLIPHVDKHVILSDPWLTCAMPQ